VPLTDRTIILDWQVSSYFGWGLYGLNLMLNWSLLYNCNVMTSGRLDPKQIELNPVEREMIRKPIETSQRLHKELQTYQDQTVTVDVPVLHALGNDMRFSAGVRRVKLAGTARIGLIFFEATHVSAEGYERAKTFPLIVAGSTWNRAMLEQLGIGPSALILQGVDPTHFHPAPRAGWFQGRFTVFSGGKLEYRKGQDLVLKAFRLFAERRPEALLVTAWHSPWPSAAQTLARDPTLAPIARQPDGSIDVAGWIRSNGIRADQFVDLGALPNSAMPRLYREMDVALFPNRCEGGTNLVAMECMASGVPAILSANTGHLDIIGPDRCYPLGRQSPITGREHQGWGESDPEEIVEALETVWQDRADSAARAAHAASFMSGLTWRDTATNLAKTIAPLI
jgi:glycosyltransferase involved in cell wall biosynthesis